MNAKLINNGKTSRYGWLKLPFKYLISVIIVACTVSCAAAVGGSLL